MPAFLLPVLLGTGCLVNQDLYDQRRAALTDDDGDGLSDEQGDCDDSDPSVLPGATETCDGKDNDCNGSIDDAPADVRWYPDVDQDGYGAAELALAACEAPPGYVATSGDCDDGDPAVHPGADETCNGLDDDCDGAADEEPVVDAPTWYLDADEDGWGDAERAVVGCGPGADYVELAGDCNDLDPDVHPEAEEECGNGIDDDCDGDPGECRWDGEVSVEDAAASFSGATPGDHVGAAIAALGDIDGDGIGEVAVGAYGLDSTATDAGRVYLFQLDATGALEDDDAEATIDGTAEFGFAGWTLATVDDFDKDGINDLVVGANNFDRSGAAFLFTGPLSGALSTDDALVWLTTPELAADLGSAVADGGDADGDGYGALLVGASGAGSDDAGAAYLLSGLASGGVNADDADLRMVGAAPGDAAGFAVASGDFDGDGVTDYAIGAPGSDLGATDGGAVHFVLGPMSGDAHLGEADYSVVADGAGDTLGARLVSRGDNDGDGFDEVVGSAPFDDTLFNDGGALFILDSALVTSIALSDAPTVLRGADANALLGAALDIGLDHNGDGLPDLVVGTAPQDGGAGRLQVFYGPLEGTLDTTSAASFVSDQPGDGTGFSAGMGEVHPEGDVRLLVGATERNEGAGQFWITETSRE